MLVDEIAARLVSQAVGIAPATTGTSTQWTVYKMFIPDAPDRVVAVFPSGGGASWPRDAYRTPTFQVRVRGPGRGASTALGRCELVITALDKVQATLSGTTFVDIRQAGDVLPLGYDNNNRPEFSINFETIRAST